MSYNFQSPDNIKSTNNLTDESFIKYKNAFLESNKIILENYLLKSELYMIWSEDPNRCWYKNEPIFKSKINLCVPTDIHYSKFNIMIPIEFKVLMTAILCKDLKVEGIFRYDADYHEMEKLTKNFKKMYQEKLDTENIEKYLINNHKTLTLTKYFLMAFREFDGQLFPAQFVSVLQRIFYGVESEKEKIICYKAIIYSFTKNQRCLLESLGRFTEIVAKENSKRPNAERTRMSYRSICVSYMVDVFLKDGDLDWCKNFHYINTLADVLTFILKNIAIIFTIVDCGLDDSDLEYTNE